MDKKLLLIILGVVALLSVVGYIYTFVGSGGLREADFSTDGSSSGSGQGLAAAGTGLLAPQYADSALAEGEAMVAVGSAGLAVPTANGLKAKQATVSIEIGKGQLEQKLREARRVLEFNEADTVAINYGEVNGQKTYFITFKVSPSNFEKVVEDLKKLGEVKDVNINVEDVTREYRDVNIRLNNSELELQRLYELYHRSASIEELLTVEREITRVTADLEQLKAQKELLETSVEKSRITLELREAAFASEVQEARITLKVAIGQLEPKLETLKRLALDSQGNVTSAQLIEGTADKRYLVHVKINSTNLEPFLSSIRELGEVRQLEVSIDVEKRPTKSIVYLALIEDKPALETSLLIPLERLVNTFFAAFSTGIIIISGFIGFLLAPIILLAAAYLAYKRLRGNLGKPSSKR